MYKSTKSIAEATGLPTSTLNDYEQEVKKQEKGINNGETLEKEIDTIKEGCSLFSCLVVFILMYCNGCQNAPQALPFGRIKMVLH